MSLRAGTKRKALSTSGSPAVKRVKVEDDAMASMVVKGGSASTEESAAAEAKPKKSDAMKNRRTSGRGVAQKVAKKKQPQKVRERVLSPAKATHDDTSARQRSSSPGETAEKAPEKVLSADSTTTQHPAAKKSCLNGLLNPRNACFMNAIIQMVGAALEGQDIDEILANIDDLVSLEDFTGHDLIKADLDASLDDVTRRSSSRSKERDLAGCTEEGKPERGYQESRQRQQHRASERG